MLIGFMVGATLASIVWVIVGLRLRATFYTAGLSNGVRVGQQMAFDRLSRAVDMVLARKIRPETNHHQ